ncbi:MAG: hypothetical protein HC913_13095 [Microscillaceae bacterium]|nr:hypothetical protein [Microscillaceae bacterium]
MEKIDSKEVGLELGLRVFNFFLKTEYLHYGYFEKEMPIEIQSLAWPRKTIFNSYAHISPIRCAPS